MNEYFSWYAARHKTRPGRWQIRLRVDGNYDVREIGTDAPCIRGVSASYVHAEFFRWGG